MRVSDTIGKLTLLRMMSRRPRTDALSMSSPALRRPCHTRDTVFPSLTINWPSRAPVSPEFRGCTSIRSRPRSPQRVLSKWGGRQTTRRHFIAPARTGWATAKVPRFAAVPWAESVVRVSGQAARTRAAPRASSAETGAPFLCGRQYTRPFGGTDVTSFDNGSKCTGR